MANKNEGGNSYTPIKNAELLEGNPDTRSLDQRVTDGPKPEVRKDNEKWGETVKRVREEKFLKGDDMDERSKLLAQRREIEGSRRNSQAAKPQQEKNKEELEKYI